ncbi:hypothetical protein L1887_47123 [Cichorium endivia]|nr:hypothetical protein L1887_47123 [Cichorium endivia]
MACVPSMDNNVLTSIDATAWYETCMAVDTHGKVMSHVVGPACLTMQRRWPHNISSAVIRRFWGAIFAPQPAPAMTVQLHAWLRTPVGDMEMGLSFCGTAGRGGDECRLGACEGRWWAEGNNSSLVGSFLWVKPSPPAVAVLPCGVAGLDDGGSSDAGHMKRPERSGSQPWRKGI